jgi:hypothetical protein
MVSNESRFIMSLFLATEIKFKKLAEFGFLSSLKMIATSWTLLVPPSEYHTHPIMGMI